MCYARWRNALRDLLPLLLVPVIIRFFVLDLKLIKWKPQARPDSEDQQPEVPGDCRSQHTTVSVTNG